jgi:hypothetical protein
VTQVLRGRNPLSESFLQLDFEHASFARWLTFTFEDCVSESDRFGTLPEPTTLVAAQVVLNYCTQLFRDPTILRERYFQEVLGKVFWAMPGIDGYLTCLNEKDLDWSLRAGCVDSMYDLFDGLFRHFPQGPVSDSAFMWWEYLGGALSAVKPLERPTLRLLKRLLAFEEPHVQMSALHGLNEFHREWNADHVAEIIDRYLERNQALDPKLEAYARVCREGGAQ